MRRTDGEDDRLWAITSYYNPVGYRMRRENYRRFRDSLGVPLVAVELAYRDDFELEDGDADILIRLRGRDVMWQKERLLNVALKAVPSGCRKVAWVDADVIFARDDWAAAASDLLDRWPMVQLFEHVHYMPCGLSPERFAPDRAELNRQSVTSAAVGAADPGATLNAESPFFVGAYATGMAWAARRDLLDVHGFYDRCIVGSGDRAMVAAAWGAFDHVLTRFAMGEAYARHFLAWAKRFRDDVGGRIAPLDGDVFHLWHGALGKRANSARHRELSSFGYDPFSDLALTPEGPWQWNSDKPAMHAYLRSYFASRQEDGAPASAPRSADGAAA